MATSVALLDYTPAQISLIKRECAASSTDDEFNMFMAAARNYSLDPFRKQICQIVFNAKNAERRRAAIVITRDGKRVMAQRCGDYRPASKPPEYVEGDEARDPDTNPQGLISASVVLHMQDASGNWQDVYGEAEWDECAPVKDEGAFCETKRRKAPTGKKIIDGMWKKMPRLMLAKCAEAQALRAGWPETFGGAYFEEEVEAMQYGTASDAIREEEERQRLERIGGSVDVGSRAPFDCIVLNNINFSSQTCAIQCR